MVTIFITVHVRQQRLLQQSIDTLENGYRITTTRSYRSRMNGYIRFCTFYRYKAMPTDEWTLIQFSRYLANGVTAYETVKGYLSTIKKCHELAEIPFPDRCPILRHHMMAIKKELARPVHKASPITPQDLLQMYTKMDRRDIVQVTCYAALVIGFTLFLRKSNLVPDTRNSFNAKEQLTISDVGMMGHVYVYSIMWCKTNQYRNRDLLLPIIPACNKIVCCEFWTKYLLKQNRAFTNGPLVAYPKGDKLVPITYDVLLKQLKVWISQIGKQPADYSLHGLRRGGANHALSVGICGEDLKLMGDWASDAYLEYVDLTLERRVTNMVKFVEEVDRVLDEYEDENWLDMHDQSF